MSRPSWLVLLAASLPLLACPPAPGPGDAGSMAPPRYRVDQGVLRVASGEALLLRGINLSNSIKYRPDHLYPLGAADLARLAAGGFNSVRVLALWQAIMPAGPDAMDDGYLDGYAAMVEQLSAAGFYVVVDLHQDLFGSPFSPGAPEWACPESIRAGWVPQDPWWLNYLTDQVSGCFDHFWLSTELQEHLARAWSALAARVCRSPGVVGFDLLNEPWPGTALGDARWDNWMLLPFYLRLVDAVDAACPGRVFFLEPSLAASVGVADRLVIPEDYRSRVVLAPHFYPSAVHDPGPGYSGDVAELQGFMDARLGGYQDAGVPLWVGEYGGLPANPNFSRYLEDVTTLLYRAGAGSALYEYSQGDGTFSFLEASGEPRAVFQSFSTPPVPTLLPGRPGTPVPRWDGGGLDLDVDCRAGAQLEVRWPRGTGYRCTINHPDIIPDFVPGTPRATCRQDGGVMLECRATPAP